MTIFLFLSLLFLFHAGEVCLPKTWVLSWTYPDDSTIEFVLLLDEATWVDYEWVGIGFKYPEEMTGMTGADMTNIILNELPTDRYSDFNEVPELDIDLGGTDDVVEPTVEGLGYTWKRPIDSGDQYDKVYVVGANLRLLWACGQVDGGVQVKHLDYDRGTVDIVLSEEFYHGCEESFLQLN